MARRSHRGTVAGQKNIGFMAVVGVLGYFNEIVDRHRVDTELCRTVEGSSNRGSLERPKVNEEQRDTIHIHLQAPKCLG